MAIQKGILNTSPGVRQIANRNQGEGGGRDEEGGRGGVAGAPTPLDRSAGSRPVGLSPITPATLSVGSGESSVKAMGCA